MRPGNGSLVVLIVCYAPMNRSTRNGFTFRRIPFEQASSRTGETGHTGSSSTRNNNYRAGASPAEPRVPNSHQRLASDVLGLQSVHLPGELLRACTSVFPNS